MRPLAAVILLVLCARAGADVPPKLPLPPPPPPAIKRITAPAMNLLLALETWQKDAARGVCFAAEPTLENDIQNTVTRIRNHQDPVERKAAGDWWDREMRPWLMAWTQGVPGIGSYPDLARRRNESLAFYQNNELRGRPNTDEERLSFARKLVAYKQRARADLPFLETLRAASSCFKSNRLADLRRPLGLFDGYENWHRMVDPLAMRRLGEARASAMPPLNDDEARRHMDKLKALPPDARQPRAELVHLGFGVLERLARDEPRAEIIAAFADSFDDPAERQAVAGTAARVRETRVALEQTLATELRRLTLAPESAGKEKGIARTLFSGWKAIVHGRATSPLLRDRGSDSGHIEVEGVKYIYTAGTEFEGFDVEYIARDARPLWRDLPGIAAADICALTYAKARRYTKGFDRKLKSWVIVYQSTAYPILCVTR